MKTIQTIGFAAGAAANDVNTALGPWYWYYHPELFKAFHLNLKFLEMIEYTSMEKGQGVLPQLQEALHRLSSSIQKNWYPDAPLLVLGGDHSMAMGTWPSIVHAYPSLGLIWVDAHLDAHTPDSSTTKNLHGMPLARLLGLWGGERVFTPEQVCVLGIRSYEPKEYQHLKSLGVKLIMMDEILQKGLSNTLQEAIDYLKNNCTHLGLSIDLDAFDPIDCPGVGYREKNGIRAQDFFDFFQRLAYKDWVAIEVAEFNPIQDIEQKTALWLPQFLKHLLG
jgi:arginase